MSLVHEALKRADEEKGQRLAGVTPPGPPAVDVSEPPRPWFRRLLIPLCIVVVVAGVVTYGIRWAAGRFLTEATAAVDDLKQQATAAFPAAAPAVPLASTVLPQAKAPAESPAMPTPQPKAMAPSNTALQTPAPEPGQQIDPELVKQIAKRLMSEMNLPAGIGADPTGDGKAEPSPSEAGSTADTRPAGPTAQTKAVAPKPTTLPRKDPPSVTPKTASAERPAPVAPTPQPATPSVEEKPKPPVLPVDTSHLKVSSIVWGPQGGTAIINGRPVRVGDTVGGATITKITPRTVEVEIDGRRATLALG